MVFDKFLNGDRVKSPQESYHGYASVVMPWLRLCTHVRLGGGVVPYASYNLSLMPQILEGPVPVLSGVSFRRVDELKSGHLHQPIGGNANL